MRGTRPDVEFEGRRIIPHADLTAALIDGTLNIDESDFVFIDHSQTFKPEFVASLAERPAQDLILRYATVMLMREICSEQGFQKITRSVVTSIEGKILARLPARIRELNLRADTLRRHPMRRHKVPENVATAQRILQWDERLRTKGFASLVDRRYLSGNRNSKLHPVVGKIVAEVLKERVTREKPKVTALHKEIEKRVLAERKMLADAILLRRQNGETVSKEDEDYLEEIVPPCRQTVKNWKDLVAPLEQIFQINGPDWLLRNQLISGEGLHVERAGQIVMIDEYDIDLMTIIPYEFLIHWLGAAKLSELKITGDKPLRVVLSVTLDAFTGCILGLQIGMTATPELAKRTVMMSMMDKTEIGKACGAEGRWDQFLRPEKLMHDSGNAYTAFVTDAMCSALKIDKIAAPKAKAYIRGLLERIFRTVHENLLASIPGKTFSNTVLRGEYDSQAEAVLSLDDLIQVLTVWIVDIYHNCPNSGRDGQTPADLWRHEMTVGMGCRPVPSVRVMTHVFGTTLSRQAQQTGIRIAHANYFSKEFALHLLRNPTRQFRIRWWEENMSEAQVEIRPNIWIPLEVMDVRARGLCSDKWDLVLKRAHIDRDPDAAEKRRRAEGHIDDLIEGRIALRRKMARRRITTEADIIKLEEQSLRYFTTPTSRIAGEQSHGLYGVPILNQPNVDSASPGEANDTDELSGAHGDPARNEMKDSRGSLQGKTPTGRRKTKTWKPGTME
ncbi:hypothetical protein IMCC21224_112439 [Puniceibacterium sp. IMCC21224]|nr:hypothetical protein IMCC21224_112439 [Puniceibacterium sp. IMCC21224]